MNNVIRLALGRLGHAFDTHQVSSKELTQAYLLSEQGHTSQQLHRQQESRVLPPRISLQKSESGSVLVVHFETKTLGLDDRGFSF